jgi:hypothetical protein
MNPLLLIPPAALAAVMTPAPVVVLPPIMVAVPVVQPVAPARAPYAYALPTVPGLDNPAVTQDTLDATICNHKKYDRNGNVVAHGGFTWIHWQRPPTSYTNAIKKRLMVELNLPGNMSDYELDHETPIEAGGDPGGDPERAKLALWMQPYAGVYGARRKDRVETFIAEHMCPSKSGPATITLDEGRTALKTDWVAAYQKYIGPLPQ